MEGANRPAGGGALIWIEADLDKAASTGYSSESHYIGPSMRSVSAAEANRSFSKLLGAVKAGETVIVTSHGQPVAKLVPYADDAERQRREEARREMQARWAAQAPMDIEPWTRDELYDDAPDA
jgi:prevent-host-death family protein